MTVAQLHSHDAQQVVAEDLAVRAFYDKRLIALILHLRQPLTEFRREHGFIRALPHLPLFISLRQTGILQPHTPEHRLIHRLQHRVCCGVATLLDAFHSGFDAVRCDGLHHLTGVQFCLQQLTIHLLLRGLLHNLLENLILRLREILALCLPSLFP